MQERAKRRMDEVSKKLDLLIEGGAQDLAQQTKKVDPYDGRAALAGMFGRTMSVEELMFITSEAVWRLTSQRVASDA